MFTPPEDDREALSVGEVEKALLVEPADIAEHRPAMLVVARRGCLRIIVIGEVDAALEADQPLRARRQNIAPLIADMHLAGHRAADRAGMGEPLR
jgi:hypothetical protein